MNKWRNFVAELVSKKYLTNPKVDMDGFIIGYENIDIFKPKKVGRDE